MTNETRAQELLRAYYDEVAPESSLWAVKPAEFAAGRAILEADPHLRIAVMRAALHLSSPRWSAPYALLLHLSKRFLPYSVDDIQSVLRGLSKAHQSYHIPFQALLRALAHPLADPEHLALCRPDLERLRTAAETWYASAEQRKFLKLLDTILGGQQERPLTIRPDDWGKRVTALLTEMEPDLRERWLALLTLCATVNSSTPSGKWLAQMQPLIEKLGKDHFSRLATAWLGAFRGKQNTSLNEDNATLLKGLAWCCADNADAALASTLADAAIEGYHKIGGIGPRSAKVASACVSALKQMSGLHGAAQLERVRLGVKQPTYRASIEQALDEAAHRAGMSRADLEEITVPTFGLEQGRICVPIESAVAELQIAGLTVSVQWYDAAGRSLKREPADVKRACKAEFNDLKRLCDDIAHMLVAQRDRIEQMPLRDRTWSLLAWRERYLDHPLVGNVARRLIWRFTDGKRSADAIWLDGQLVDVNDQPVQLSDKATVAAWHPIMSDAAEVLGWRNWLERHQITQPFKQAHREIYLLTDAERATHRYSNRFAAHILRQHQFNALAAARGWHNKLRLMVDDEYPPATLELSRWGVRAEFWIEGAGDEYGMDTTDAGTYLYVATDQVRFYPIDALANSAHAGGGGYVTAYDWQRRQHPIEHEPLPLEQIPPLVFSEVMRDVDLFVGVASVGNDPTWEDGSHQGRYHDYWRSYSFGELSATAETRKQVLSRLIPRLAIADRCTMEGRFLVVRGDLRTYHIHLGSGNILMEPNSQYLCIVPKAGSTASTTDKLFLPFEGDAVLSIILSKAFLLAEDTKITDPSITHQIGKARQVAT